MLITSIYFIQSFLVELILTIPLFSRLIFKKKETGVPLGIIEVSVIAGAIMVLLFFMNFSTTVFSVGNAFFVIDGAGIRVKLLFCFLFLGLSFFTTDREYKIAQTLLVLSFLVASFNNLWAIVVVEVALLFVEFFLSGESKIGRTTVVKAGLSIFVVVWIIFKVGNGNLSMISELGVVTYLQTRPVLLMGLFFFGRHIFLFPLASEKFYKNESEGKRETIFKVHEGILRAALFIFFLRIILSFQNNILIRSDFQSTLSKVLIISMIVGAISSLWERSLRKIDFFSGSFLYGLLLIINLFAKGQYLIPSVFIIVFYTEITTMFRKKIYELFNNTHLDRLRGNWKYFFFEGSGHLFLAVAFLFISIFSLFLMEKNEFLLLSKESKLFFLGSLLLFFVGRGIFLYKFIQKPTRPSADLLIKQPIKTVAEEDYRYKVTALYFFPAFLLILFVIHGLIRIDFFGI